MQLFLSRERKWRKVVIMKNVFISGKAVYFLVSAFLKERHILLFLFGSEMLHLSSHETVQMIVLKYSEKYISECKKKKYEKSNYFYI